MEEYIKNKIKNYYKNKKQTGILVNKYINKCKEDIIFRIIKNLASRTKNILVKNNIKKEYTHMELIGCSSDELKLHLEIQLKNNMNFDNYGEWEIDHIKPISLFDLNNENELLECFNYKNLQPLWAKENQKKSNKFIFVD
jgi:hypothetical protein